MSRGKRARVVEDSENVEEEEQAEILESASSALRPSAVNKRQRVESSPSIDASSMGLASRSSSQPLEDHELASTQYQRHGGILAEYERERDAESAAPSEIDEEVLEQMTQSMAARAQTRPDPGSIMPAECGILERVVITNFMCHTKLEVPLGPLINFIIGHNGSGKSAVLTAITLCLGGKATSTNRGASLKDLIKHGCDHAVLEVRIKNQGIGAYRASDYGDSIHVERHFTIHGTSGFKLKSANNRLISTKKADLDAITDYYALQLDNPVNVLTQDLARQFISSSNDKDKYTLFVKGVQLEQLDNDYQLLGLSLDQTDAFLEQSQETGKSLVEAYKEASERYKQISEQASMNERLSTLRRMIAWKQIEKQEEEIDVAQGKVDNAERRVAKCERDYEQKSNAFSDAEDHHNEAISRSSEAQQAEEPLQQEFDTAKSTFDEAKKAILQLNHDQRTLDGELKSQQARLQSAEKKVEDEYRRLQEAGGDNEAAKVSEIRDSEAELEAAKTALDEHKQKLPGLQSDENQARQNVDRAEGQRRAKDLDLKAAKGRLGELQNTRERDQWAGFLPNMRTLVEAIARETRFQRKPVGPFGKHIRLTKPDWSSVLESYLGNALNGFAVTTKADQSLLADLMRRCRCDRAPIFFGSDAPLSNIRQPQGYNTIMKVLEIDNELVRKHLIVNQLIDQTVIMESVKDVMDLMRGANQFPEHMRSVLTKNAHNIGFGQRWNFTSAGAQVSSPINKWRNQPRMVMDDREAIRAQEAIVDQMKQDLMASEDAKRVQERKAVEGSQALQRHKRETTTLRTAEQTADERLQDLKAQLEQLRPGDGQLDAFKEVVESLKGSVEHYRTQMTELRNKKDETALQNAGTKRALDTAEAALKEKQAEIAKAQDRVQKYATGRQNTLRHKNEADATRNDAKSELERLRETVAELQALLATDTETARGISERIPVPANETKESLFKKHDQLKKRWEETKARIGGSEADLKTALVLATKRVTSFDKKFKMETAHRDMLHSALMSRRERWKRFRTAISVRARSNFMSLLAERRFRGNMVIDHRSRQLQLLVEPDPSRKARSAGSKTTALSGGERSFTTLCMLLALWDAMGSPIRCLDEFDVYMDAANRDMSMKMLIEAAKSSVGRQYVFITPQAMNNAEADSAVRCIRLEDPERGQSTLTQGRAAITRG